MRRDSGGRGSDGARTEVLLQHLHFEDLGTGAVFGLLDLRTVNLDLVANLDTGRIAFERVGLRVAGSQLEPFLTRDDTSVESVMAAADFDRNDDGHRDNRADAECGAHDFAAGWTNIAEGAESLEQPVGDDAPVQSIAVRAANAVIPQRRFMGRFGC